MDIKKRLACAAAGAALLTGSALVAASPAMATRGDPGLVYQGTDVRYGPSTFYGIVYITSVDAKIPLNCYTDDGTGHRWFSFYLQSQRWVLADDVAQPQPVLPHC